MERKDIQTVLNINAVIEQAEDNIKKLELFNKAKEIKISTTDQAEKVNPIYITGKKKDEVINILKQKQQEFLNKQIEELKKI